ncbi:ANTAR domain-containing response regulator [Pigmentiphaga litoralis]|uniref:Response regulator NasT n=1 Tax=Pigmentiphaga litoralis TaxID=516702 RepID=A0A7Y9LN07_9BURK|nr:ANTAR domain-containing protein [Pigmentiphaga litoralis]NYE23708.1 response regulator NasT [Pigmentiphaga litoralis]NYE82678.1 response regulator NasT [Pigmentiphaga litoralis]
MLNVVLINDGSGRAVSLRKTLAEAGVNVIAEIEASVGMASVIAKLKPDVVLIDSDAPSRDTLEDVCVASEHSARPVVMFTGDGGRNTIRLALEVGVAAYVVGEVPATRIQTLLDVAIERFSVERELREELQDAKKKLAERQWVDKAKGLLMQLRGVSEDEAYKLLRERAMQSQRRIGDVAREMVEVAGWLKP